MTKYVGSAGTGHNFAQTDAYVAKKAAIGGFRLPAAGIQQIGHIETVKSKCRHTKRLALRPGFEVTRESGGNKAGTLTEEELSDTSGQGWNSVESDDGKDDICGKQ